MVYPFSGSDKGNFVLVFGSQALDFSEASASQLRSALLGNQSLRWIIETIEELPKFWTTISKKLPGLEVLSDNAFLVNLNVWLKTGSFPKGSFPLPNTILTPLVVISQLTQFLRFIELCQPDPIKQDGFQEALKYKTETLGLCTGLLSSAAVSCSANKAQLQRYGALAIRLAMVIGALVDAKDQGVEAGGEWKSYSVAWGSAELDTEVVEILKEFPEAYISVVFEDKRVTISTPKDGASQLQQELKTAGFSVTEIGLRGSFHSELNEPEADHLIKLCDMHPELQFLDGSELIFKTRSNTGGDYIDSGMLHHAVVRSMLAKQSNWQQAFASLQTSTLTAGSLVVTFGQERCAPPWLIRRLGPRLVQLADLDRNNTRLPTNLWPPEITMGQNGTQLNEPIAVVGMSCQLPGGEDLGGFWDALCQGKSQHIEVPADRFDFSTSWRDNDPRKKWYGNFIDNYDTFDHKFFKKSPREMASTDPQHRLMLQIAYQAVEQSGYFNSPSPDPRIGCYIGVGLVDYENNIACYPATAYTATGNLKAFAAGKISHYFGWTGPGLTIDTACSSSAVAVHQACKAILTGECSAALAGGVNVMTSPEWFQNLAGASFLSPTGQCKPFDVKADGYCRAEAVGAVFLKKLSAAIADGDQVLGVIASSAVYQNENCTPITVPNASSLSELFRHVVSDAKLAPEQISVVEAHGTGTPVGDPAEYQSVRDVFGGSLRSQSLSIGSVKGLLGHTESASGIVALIKTLLMIIKGFVPPQASFETINPAIKTSPSDNMEITTRLRPWDVDFRAALINNYGASGSNASLVITQAPRNPTASKFIALQPLVTKYPFWLCGFDDKSLKAYAAKLIQFLKNEPEKGRTIADISFALSRQSNRALDQALIFSCSSINELEEKLAGFLTGKKDVAAVSRLSSPRPVILCFGGQVSKFVGLDREVFENVKILRVHLDHCNRICQSLLGESIYPDIFDKTTIRDTVKLQLMLFALQYSCARSWIDCGLKVAAVVGHSFGELTAMCISGTLSLEDTVKMIAGRARIIRDSWGPEKGSMVAVQADLEVVERLIAESSKLNPNETAVTIACFNGPKSFTLAGSVKAIELLMKTAADAHHVFLSPIKIKKLDVTNSFHSTLVEPLVPDLERLGKELHLVFREPTIPLERAVEDEKMVSLDYGFVAAHLRKPVYFNHAVQRLLRRYPSSIWLEAGSNSTVTTMAGQALGIPSSAYFQAINITSGGSFSHLTEATAKLWKEGLTNSFWAHHASQTTNYSLLLLPPYQFEKAKHWMELKKPQKALGDVPVQNLAPESPQGLTTFVGYQDTSKRRVRFRVNTMTEKYQKYVSAHVIAQSAPICPSTYQLVIVIDALMSVHPKTPTLNPELRGMDSHAPLCMDESKAVWLDAERDAEDSLTWSWKMTSAKIDGGASNPTLHVSGKIVFRRIDDSSYQHDFAKYERLVGMQRCSELLNNHDVEGIIQGSRNIYKAFSEIVQYKDDVYKGLRKIVGKGNESAGRIAKRHLGETWLDLGLADTFCQVAGIYLNSMTDKSDNDMYISDRIDGWIRSPRAPTDSQLENWEVFACHHRLSDRENISDVFVFDPVQGQLVEVILGIHYVKVSRNGLGKTLARLAGVSTKKITTAAADTLPSRSIPAAFIELTPPLSPQLSSEGKAPEEKLSQPDILPGVRELLCNLSGLEPEEIHSDSDLADLGIDSLMGMELAREVEATFKCTLDTSDLLELTDFESLVKCIQGALGFSDDSVQSDEEQQAKGSENSPGNIPTPHEHDMSDLGNGTNGHTNGNTGADGLVPAAFILEAFAKTSQATDHFLKNNGFADYVGNVLPGTTELCVIHIADAFDDLGCSIRKASSGQILSRIQYLPKHEQFVEFIYDLLEKAQLVQLDGSRITRTAVPVPSKSASETLEDLLRDSPDHAYDHKLTYLAGCKLAECLKGKTDALQLIFGSAEGREIASGMYGKSPINVAWIKQIEYFLKEFFLAFPADKGPINILEMGSGTGGTTARLIPMLAALNVPFIYTVTDLSSSLVAGARKRFKQYSFMKYKTLDIESPPSADMLHSQHIVLATNCVHATHSLVTSTKNIHNILRPDGFLMMLEMIQPLPWIDLIFGLLEGWWLFDDGRRHALAPPEVWQRTMKSVGYGHVAWTRGNRPESDIQSVIIGLASPRSHDQVSTPSLPKPFPVPSADLAARQAVVDAFIDKYTRDFAAPIFSNETSVTGNNKEGLANQSVLVTGATGSLGSYLVAHLVALPTVRQVICLNRKNTIECTTRQHQALELKGIFLDSPELSKLKVYEADTAKPLLGLTKVEYIKLVNSVTHIVHNAWPMSLTRSVNAFEGQFRTMNNLINLARESRSRQHPGGPKIGFQFISSIATVGYYPLSTGDARVPEKRMTIDSVMPNGYGDAKFVCERMLDETLHKYPDEFRPMVVRIGQIAGSKTSGYWNPVEHLAFLIKSSQTLKTLPDFEGELSWCPVNDVAATLGDLLISETRPYPIYHIENPSRQPWRDMIIVLAEALDIPRSNIIPFEQFVERVRNFPGSSDTENPAAKIVEFFDTHFVRMSCGGLILDTTKSGEHSHTLRNLGPVDKDLVLKYIRAWQKMGFLAD